MSHMKAAEKKFENDDWIPPEPKEIDRDYKVPNFGMDRDISDGIENMSVAEGIVKHKWTWNGKKYKNPARHNDHTPYYEEGSRLDEDIRISQKNQADTEKILETKMELP